MKHKIRYLLLAVVIMLSNNCPAESVSFRDMESHQTTDLINKKIFSIEAEKSDVQNTHDITIKYASKDKPFFQASQKHPYHVSVGAVLFDQNGRIACHHFRELLGHKDIYILMRESMENDETPLMTMHRGLKEEFGAVAEPVAFLGCLSGYLPDARLPFEKTTLYIATRLISWSPERDMEDPEASSVIEWLEPKTLISLMQQQGIRFPGRIDADESEMIKRALPYIQQGLE